MTKKEQLKVLNDKINANRADFNLNRQTAKISALATGDLDKYEYLTGEETNYRSNPVEQKRFEYLPLGKVFNKGLIAKDDGDDGILKRLDKIGKANQELLDKFNSNDRLAIKGDKDDTKPAIKGNNGGNNGCNNGGNNGGNFKLPKDVQKSKQYLINNKVLLASAESIKYFDNIVEIRKLLKNKLIYYYDNNYVLNTRSLKNFIMNKIDKDYINGLINNFKTAINLKEKGIVTRSIRPTINNTKKLVEALALLWRMTEKKYLGTLNNPQKESKWKHDTVSINLINDDKLFKKISNDLSYESNFLRYDDELDAIKKFVTDINGGLIKNKEQAAQDFRELKTKVKNEEYINNYMQRIEQALFGDDLEKVPQKGSGLKILTPKQMLSRLPILLAEIQAGKSLNN